MASFHADISSFWYSCRPLCTVRKNTHLSFHWDTYERFPLIENILEQGLHCVKGELIECWLFDAGDNLCVSFPHMLAGVLFSRGVKRTKAFFQSKPSQWTPETTLGETLDLQSHLDFFLMSCSPPHLHERLRRWPQLMGFKEMSPVQSECPGDIRPAVLRWQWEVFTDSLSPRKMQRKKKGSHYIQGPNLSNMRLSVALLYFSPTPPCGKCTFSPLAKSDFLSS